MASTTHTGSVVSSDPRAAQQAASIGATIGSDGWWYKDGKRLTPQEADQLTQQAGTAVTSTDTAHGEKSHGYLSDRLTANQSWLQPLTEGALGLIPGIGIPLAAGTGALWNYSNTHNVGDALKGGLSGAAMGGVGSMAGKMLGKVMGGGAAASKLIPDGKGGFVNAFGQPRNGSSDTLVPDGKGGFVNAFGQPRNAPGVAPPAGGYPSDYGDAADYQGDNGPETGDTSSDWLSQSPAGKVGLSTDPTVNGQGMPGIEGLDNATMPSPGNPTAGLIAKAAAAAGGMAGLTAKAQQAVAAGQSTANALGIPGLKWGDILKGAGAGIEAYTQQQDTAAQLAERKREFDQSQAQQQAQYARSISNAESQQAAQLQSLVNRAPMADKAQSLLMSRMSAAPTAFKPRDYTQGLSNIQPGQTASGGPADQMASAQTAAANYTPGSGGVNTDTYNLLLNRLKGNALAKSGMAG